MNYGNITKKIMQDLFRKHSEKVKVYLRSNYSKGNNYDPFRKTGLVKERQNPLFVKAIINSVSDNSLILRELGLTEAGAIALTIRDSDVNLLKNAEEVKARGNTYYIYNDAVGNRMQINQMRFGYSAVIVFRKDI